MKLEGRSKNYKTQFELNPIDFVKNVGTEKRDMSRVLGDRGCVVSAQ